jgi:hypothetical protein
MTTMNQEEIERCKNDPIYFFENYLQLETYQVEALRAFVNRPVVILKASRDPYVPYAALRVYRDCMRLLQEKKHDNNL